MDSMISITVVDLLGTPDTMEVPANSTLAYLRDIEGHSELSDPNVFVYLSGTGAPSTEVKPNAYSNTSLRNGDTVRFHKESNKAGVSPLN